MTGSGAAIFGMCSDVRSAPGAATRLREHGLWVELVEVLAVSPAAAQ